MTAKIYAKLMVGIPIQGSPKKRWRQVGVVLQYPFGDDKARGPGLSIMLDKDFNPGGVDNNANPASVALQMFWPDDPQATRSSEKNTPPEDDIPF